MLPSRYLSAGAPRAVLPFKACASLLRSLAESTACTSRTTTASTDRGTTAATVLSLMRTPSFLRN